MKKLRIGAAQGFYGDSILPAVETARHGDVQYLCFDCLAELTLAILQKDRQKDPAKGYTRDITLSMQKLLPYVQDKGIKILTNAGGMNPAGAQQEVMRIAHELGMQGLKVAVVTGDDILERLPKFRQQGISLQHMEDGRDIDSILDRIVFANAYLGVDGIVEALRQGADIVITGRTTDSAQFLAPLVYEFGWGQEDWNRLAQGILMGHLMECSGQATGGNFSGNWQAIEDFERLGFPVAEIREDGEFILTKTVGTGGLVSIDTVKEQLLYEIHDPSAYMTPDVVLNMTDVRLEDTGPNRVRVTGAQGAKRPDRLKVVMGYSDGWLGQAMAGYSWPDALGKAQAADRILRKQMERIKLQYDEIQTDYLGYNSLHGRLARVPEEELNEVYLRMVVRTQRKEEAAKLGRLFPPLALNGPPSMSGFTGMMPPRELLGMWSCLIPREVVESKVQVNVSEVE
ncbi:acyclic terpene utilization AtuA family protein [Aneurinibacillus tyrosinisolvens]|uniref:acyclic terpene utilization AtuA family protein n=1 Tax=Aneurinibacillus tyrosinisolvens TaxID=1443435 RepID=UPI00063FD041|nr:acyclic terpene utilization AtuA family protein [Aneurinibacillus tyrosinisolvens]